MLELFVHMIVKLTNNKVKRKANNINNKVISASVSTIPYTNLD